MDVLAALGTYQNKKANKTDFDRLTSCLPALDGPGTYLDGVLRAIAPTSRRRMSIKELDVLLALCATAPKIQELEHAEALVAQLSTYLPEAHTQLLAPSHFLREIKPSPWTVLTQQLMNALVVLGLRFPAVEDTVKASVASYLSNWSQASNALAAALTGDDDAASNEAEAVELAAVAVSLAGFMTSTAQYENFWNPAERLELISTVKSALSQSFLVALEKAASILRNSPWSDPVARDWKRSLKHYAANGCPVGAMLMQQGFMRLTLAFTSRLLCNERTVEKGELLQQFVRGKHMERNPEVEVTDQMVEYLTEIVTQQMNVLEDGSDYLQLSSSWQQKLAFSVKACALEAYLHCMVLDEEIADASALLVWLEDAIESAAQMAHERLARVVVQSLAVVAKYIPESMANFARMLLKLIVTGTSHVEAVEAAAQSLAFILRMLSQDAIITTLYSLGNVLSSQTGAEKQHNTTMSPSAETNGHHNSLASATKERTGSVISLTWSGDEETSLVCRNVARAIVTVAASSNDSKIITLVQTMLIQKIGRINVAVDAHIIEQAARLAIYGKESELRLLLRVYSRFHQESIKQRNNITIEAIRSARQYLAQHVDNQSPLFITLGLHLLDRIVSKGDVVEGELRQYDEMEQAALEIVPLLRPLATLASRQPVEGGLVSHPEVAALAREAWYNTAVHGITFNSRIGKQYFAELGLLALNSAPLVDPERAELLESDVELNVILRRGMNAQHAAEQKKHLLAIRPELESHVRHLSYQKIVFLNAVYMVESLRAASGSCVKILDYFADPTLQTSHLGSCLSALADNVFKEYIQHAKSGDNDDFAAPYVSRQLAQIFSACCNRSAKMQEVARAGADLIIAYAPSALCHKSALFALLELLTLMWSSCLEAEIDEYGWKPLFTSTRGKVTIEQSDDYMFRKRTLDRLYADARRWMTNVIAIAPLDVKGLLQTYLSEYDDTGSYGHISLGRSFAAEMGALIPAHDQRLGAIDRDKQTTNVNVASDFMAQYTTRQEYRFAGAPLDERQFLNFSSLPRSSLEVASQQPLLQSLFDLSRHTLRMLVDLDTRIRRHERVPTGELKEVLRHAASLLCRSKVSQTSIIHYLVHIPFQTFEKDSIKMGISLWLGVIHENPRMEPRILTEVAHAWERTIERQVGIFHPHFQHLDPFYVKMEFAPTDRQAIQAQASETQSTISPYLRVWQFFQSHFNAIRWGSQNTQRTIVRMVCRTLEAFATIGGHPLLREMHFQVVLFALRILQFSTCLNAATIWRLRDRTISAGLHWFRHPVTWSFGSNRLQLKAEVQIMEDVLIALGHTRKVGLTAGAASRPNAQTRQDLLEALLQSEIARLSAWLHPLDVQVTDGIAQQHVPTFARSAWSEDPALAVQLVTRFSSSVQLRRDVRFLLCNFPEHALHEPNAVDLLLGDALPGDVSFQLKYLLFWDDVNPMQAVVYFMPAFGNHPFILQYAMRALESHPSDITFFYVPQIVQCLRYDALEYVERYIVDTGKVSQLFAHQIIWNMKANAYKDDDSTVADPVKPVLDKVMDRLIASFTGDDKAFYEREFAFFGEVTDISGKLKPYIKKSKPEKKAKIEEELRKIKVEVGVYLPSNPDGIVVGIDRKSGKPLQSHAKAPYMATFRIRKTITPSGEAVGDEAEDGPAIPVANGKTNRQNSTSEMSIKALEDGRSYEVWQSAIFKVGDDCRQDLLALQMVSAFRGIFNSVGLDVYVFPYRVTATAPGCGVIDVLPNSISRDMLGRETVNGLYDYFVTKYGGEHSARFQEARAEFVKSLAAYSVISYLLQFKDRHNGNIMIDDKGHILHIDFGFCFDIAPGGVKFERAPFKLTPEMLAVMGGSDARPSQAYRWFEELTIKAFLCSRQYCDKLCHMVMLMLDSGLPCFKPDTIKNFRDRFVLDRSDKQAAEYMLGCIKKSASNFSTKVYDEFQLLTNGIPY